ncbi:hypothetical protein ACN42_g11482 [Penicillium freii]|uniref:Uncharacterized protein n=1 Tax=Penicillium freii TaxID=48697 RepID=A0A101M8A2_PENFR|nr:hypothetical protein ACN42_g11482 [Penicillium freii]
MLIGSCHGSTGEKKHPKISDIRVHTQKQSIIEYHSSVLAFSFLTPRTRINFCPFQTVLGFFAPDNSPRGLFLILA